MKMMLIEAMTIAGGMTLVGYMYMKKHPEKIKEMKKSIKEMSRIIYNKIEVED